jgi:hypothetical protein
MRRLACLGGFCSIGLAAFSVVSCSNGGGSSQCEVGKWSSRTMVVPSQAGIGDVQQLGGGDGIAITIENDHSALMDFGPMKPATASFVKAGQAGTLAVQFSGVGSGTWALDVKNAVVVTFADFGTARASATLTIGVTQPPIFDMTLKELNAQMMTGGQQVGVFTVNECKNNSMTMTSPFPNGEVQLTAVRHT